ncbi:hypothetical protein HPB49_001868 [Dermacentor silvarum]|uniref:Uncharacterized protein n=1 Tax=Dermacentor silvarum TaxID=543639 RepID=A0ACB8CNU9_DERSI|nr:hypothetical protein HPB49_001868 [Dermacentor silvarum]
MSNPASPVSRTSTAPSSGRASPAPAPMPASCPVANGNGPALRRAMLRHSSISSVEFYDVAFKVMLVGDSGVGKTCLLIRYKDGSFLSGAYISTVGMDFRFRALLGTLRGGVCSATRRGRFTTRKTDYQGELVNEQETNEKQGRKRMGLVLGDWAFIIAMDGRGF